MWGFSIFSDLRLGVLLFLACAMWITAPAGAEDQIPVGKLKGNRSADLPPTPEEVRHMLDSGAPDPPEPATLPDTTTLGPGTFHLQSGADIVDLPFTFEGGHIIIDVEINDGGIRPFFLDSGAVDTIDEEVAGEIGIETAGRARLSGVGPNRPTASLGEIAKVQIGNAVLRSMPFLATNIPNVLVDRGSRPRVAGLIGAEFFDLFVVRIDYTKHVLRLFPEGSFHFAGPGIALPLTVAVGRVANGLHLVAASIPMMIEGVKGDFLVDTGAGSQVYLHPTFMQHYLQSNYPNPIRFLSPGGIGGRLKVGMALGSEVAIGTTKFTKPLVLFPVEQKAYPIPDHYGGLVGGGLLRNFVVTLDFRRQRIYFEPSGRTQLTQAVFGTGLIFDKPRHTDFEVIDILPGSTAEQAGVRRGDRVAEIEGHPASELGLVDADSFNGTPARQVLHIKTDDGRSFDLKISQLLP
jgi:hypothetical protein